MPKHTDQPEAGWTRQEKCPLCESASMRDLYRVPDRHYGIQGTYQEVKCAACRLVFLNPQPSEECLTRLYPKTYYSYQSFFEQPHPLKRLIKRLSLITIGTKDPAFPAPGRILDLGCGSGNFLYQIREKGWETHGVEVNSEAAELGRRAGGLDIFSGNLFQAAFPDDYFDYIRANHSFEHIVDPNETLQEIKRIVKPDGKVLIGVPNIDGQNSRCFKKYWWYLGAPVHPFSYSVKTLSRMLQKNGFHVEKVTFNSDYSGVLGSLQIFSNRKSGKLSHEGRLFNNFALIVLAQRAAKFWDFFHRGDAIEILCHKR